MQYFWQVQYNDGEKFPESLQEAKGMKQNYEDIDRDRLQFFDVYGTEKVQFGFDNGEKGAVKRQKHILRVRFDDEKKRLIYRQRHIKRVTKNSGEIEKKFWLVGWQKTVNGKNVQSIQLIFPDGHIQSIGQWQEGLIAEPEMREFEKE